MDGTKEKKKRGGKKHTRTYTSAKHTHTTHRRRNPSNKTKPAHRLLTIMIQRVARAHVHTQQKQRAICEMHA